MSQVSHVLQIIRSDIWGSKLLVEKHSIAVLAGRIPISVLMAGKLIVFQLHHETETMPNSTIMIADGIPV